MRETSETFLLETPNPTLSDRRDFKHRSRRKGGVVGRGVGPQSPSTRRDWTHGSTKHFRSFFLLISWDVLLAYGVWSLPGGTSSPLSWHLVGSRRTYSRLRRGSRRTHSRLRYGPVEIETFYQTSLRLSFNISRESLLSEVSNDGFGCFLDCFLMWSSESCCNLWVSSSPT